MIPTIRLAEVDRANWEAVIDLRVEDSQKDFLASNVYSLAEAAYEPACRPQAVYADAELVGFVMYADLALDGAPGDYMICRLMIDKRYQKMGYGRAALQETITQLSALSDCQTIKICYDPKNAVAKGFYASFGFVETGLDEDGEMIAEMRAVR